MTKEIQLIKNIPYSEKDKYIEYAVNVHIQRCHFKPEIQVYHEDATISIEIQFGKIAIDRGDWDMGLPYEYPKSSYPNVYLIPIRKQLTIF